MAVKFTKVCGLDRPRTKLDFGRITKKVTKISNPGRLRCVTFPFARWIFCQPHAYYEWGRAEANGIGHASESNHRHV